MNNRSMEITHLKSPRIGQTAGAVINNAQIEIILLNLPNGLPKKTYGRIEPLHDGTFSASLVTDEPNGAGGYAPKVVESFKVRPFKLKSSARRALLNGIDAAN